MLDDIHRRIAALKLDLSGLEIVTEAATGAYACTAVIAALAGAARVTCTSRDTARHGRFEEAAKATLSLARRAGVASRITIHRTLQPAVFQTCDILTNSGHLRPISTSIINQLPPHAVIALMFEAWEFRATDLDLAACTAKGIKVAAVNERHPDVAVFPFLGPLCARLLTQAGIALAGARIALVCDNPFAPFMRDGLVAAQAQVTVVDTVAALDADAYDAVVVAIDPAKTMPLDDTAVARLAATVPNGVIAQFWGDIDPDARRDASARIWPVEAPGAGHMAILLNALGHDPIVRLQAGGLRAAEIVRRGQPLVPDGIAELL